MKKITALILCMLLAFSCLTGCSNEPAQANLGHADNDIVTYTP